MKPLRPSLPLLLTALAAACGGDKASWKTPEEALEAGVQAIHSDNFATAVTALATAITSSDANTAYQASLYLGEAQARSGMVEEAKATFGKAQVNALYNAQGAQSVTDAWLRSAQYELAEASLAAAEAKFPDAKDLFAKQRAALEAAKSGDAAALAELGYTD